MSRLWALAVLEIGAGAFWQHSRLMIESFWPLAANGVPYTALILVEKSPARREMCSSDKERSFSEQTGYAALCLLVPGGGHSGLHPARGHPPTSVPSVGLLVPEEGLLHSYPAQRCPLGTAWSRQTEKLNWSVPECSLDHHNVRRETLSLQNLMETEKKDLREICLLSHTKK